MEFGDDGELRELIASVKAALAAMPPDHTDRAGLLNDLGVLLWELFTRTRDPALLAEAAGVAREAVNLAGPGQAERVSRLSNLTDYLQTMFSLTGKRSVLQEAIDCAREAVALAPPADSSRYVLLNTLADLLATLYKQTSDEQSLEQAVRFGREALDLTEPGHSDRPALLNNLANYLNQWYACTGNQAWLDEAIDLEEEAVRLTPSGHSDLASRLNNLGTHLRARYALTGDRATLERAVRCAQEAVDLTPPDHPDRAAWLNDLGNQLCDWYALTGDRKQLEKAVDCAREAVDLTPPGETDRADWLNNLGSHLSVRYALTGDRAALEEAVRCAREAVDTAPVGYCDRPGFLNNLGNHLADCYALTGEPATLEEAIDVAREVVKPELTPSGHIDRPSRLNNLANHLSERYFLTGDGEVLEEAVRCAREPIGLPQSQRSLLPGYLINFGNRLSDRAVLRRTPADLDEAIACARRALSLLEPGHSHRAVVLNNLGNYHGALYDLTHEPTALEEAIQYGRAAVAAGASAPDEVPPTRLRGHYMSLAGHLMARAGDQDWAEAHEVLALALRQQSDELGRQKGERSVLDYLRGKEDVYGMNVRCCLRLAAQREREGRLAEAQALREEAWTVVEHGKGRLFAALLTAERRALAPASNPRVGELLTWVDELRREWAALESARLWREDKTQVGGAAQERARRIGEIKQQTQELVAELKALDPELASLTAAQPQPLEQIRTVLEPQALLVEFYPLADELAVFVVGRRGLRVGAAPVSLARLTEWTHLLDGCVHPAKPTRFAPGDVDGFERLMEDLGAVLTPVLEELLDPAGPVPPDSAAPELIFVPTGPLHRWPLHLLPWGDGILWDAWSVSYVPTADTLFYCAGRRPEGEERSLLLAPDPSLVGSFGEALLAETLGWRVAVREAATLQTVAGSQGNLALATHVEAMPQQGASSAIRLWVGDCLGWVSAIEVLQFVADRRPAEHAELFTCGAHYEESREGDHLQGLTRSFLKAHLRSLTTTLWRVDDMAACYVGARCRDLMARRGRTKAACLRQAALELRDKGWAGASDWLVQAAHTMRRGRRLVLSLAAEYRRLAGDLLGALELWEQAQGLPDAEEPYEAAFAPFRWELGEWLESALEDMQEAQGSSDIFMATPLTVLQWSSNVLIGDSRPAGQSALHPN